MLSFFPPRVPGPAARFLHHGAPHGSAVCCAALAARERGAANHAATEPARPVLLLAARAQRCPLVLRPLLARHCYGSQTHAALPALIVLLPPRLTEIACPQAAVAAGAKQHVRRAGAQHQHGLPLCLGLRHARFGPGAEAAAAQMTFRATGSLKVGTAHRAQVVCSQLAGRNRAKARRCMQGGGAAQGGGGKQKHGAARRATGSLRANPHWEVTCRWGGCAHMC